jgi:hypothetical protein
MPDSSIKVERWELYIAHASEDKPYVESLVNNLKAAGVRVWYDKISIRWGDDIWESINNGLRKSDYVVVVLSQAFLAKKKWTEHELSAAFAMETVDQKRILPIWHGVSHKEVLEYSPALSQRRALSTADHSIQEIVNEVLKMLLNISRPGTIPVSADLTLETLAATLTRREQLAFEQVTVLSIDPTEVRNLVTTVTQPQQLGALSIVAAGTTSPGTKILSSTVYISGVKTNIDLYRLP